MTYSLSTPLLVHAALVAVSLLFGVNTVVAKFALNEVAPLDLVVLRTAGTATILFGVYHWRSPAAPRPKLTASDYGRILIYGLLGASINQIAFLEGLARSTATNASLLVVVVPVLTLAFAVALGRERASVTRSMLARHDPLRVVSWTFLLAALTVFPSGCEACATCSCRDSPDPAGPASPTSLSAGQPCRTS